MAAAGEKSRLPRERASDSAEGVPNKERVDAGPAALASDDIRLALHKVLNSPEFNSVVQLRSFLNYVVTKAVEDRPDEIKGYTIAVEALGRDASFDPVSDPIVRVEAARLRRRLDKYYAGSGAEDPLIIEIPKGTYAPQFAWRSDQKHAPAPDLQVAATAHESELLRPPVIPIGDPHKGNDDLPVFGSGTFEKAGGPLAPAEWPPEKQATADPAAPQTGFRKQLKAQGRAPVTLTFLLSVALVTFFAGLALGLSL